MIRLLGLLDAFEADIVPPGGVAYTTAAGDRVTFTNRTTALSTYNAATLYRSAVLEASTELQHEAGIPTDYTDDCYWP